MTDGGGSAEQRRTPPIFAEKCRKIAERGEKAQNGKFFEESEPLYCVKA